jgi:hypothetical protein
MMLEKRTTETMGKCSGYLLYMAAARANPRKTKPSPKPPMGEFLVSINHFLTGVEKKRDCGGTGMGKVPSRAEWRNSIFIIN